MQSLSILFRKWHLLAVLSAGLLVALSPGVTRAATNTLPTITGQPASGIAGVGEDFAFTVGATGNLPLSYQWLFEGANLAGATNSSLLLTNVSLAQGGYYAVSVSNTNGTVTSSYAELTVQTVFARRLATGRVLTSPSSPQVAVPIVMRANGRENAVSFSLAYNPNTFTNPVFLPGYASEGVTADTSQSGVIGVSVLLPPATGLPAGYIPLGLVQFDLAAGATALQGALAFTNAPMPIAATNAARGALGISAAVQPQHVLVTSAPRLDRQSGLFKQQVTISNPGAGVMTNVNVVPATLGYDSLSNSIRFYNGVATLTNLPYSDPLVEVGWSCGCGYALDVSGTNCGFSDFLACATSTSPALDSAATKISQVFAQIQNLAPGESRTLTLEFYVTDHLTVPQTTYSVYVADLLQLTLPGNVTPVSITTNRFINGTFVIEFLTQPGQLYYVQYDNTASFSHPLTAFPAVYGTGSRVQWIDDGPPKTIGPPVNGSRFYRVFQSP